MFNVLIDSCVWLDLAHDPKQSSLLLVIENMTQSNSLRLLLPQLVVDEFKRNRTRVAQGSARSLKTHIAQVKEAVNRSHRDRRRKKALISRLDDLSHRAPILGGNAELVLARIEKLFASATVIETSNTAMLGAAERALQKRAPCHHDNKNSFADALALETYLESVQAGASGDRFAFVTHNRSDFSLPNGNQKLPHPDIAHAFSKIKSLYFINLAECLRRIDRSMVSELLFEQTGDMDPRGLHELLEAEDLLFHQVWFNRHMNLQWLIEKGKHKIVTQAEWERRGLNGQHHTIDKVWEGAKRAAARALRKYGPTNLGPWDDFEWGMVNGKLSAIRWMLGYEWDTLDT